MSYELGLDFNRPGAPDLTMPGGGAAPPPPSGSILDRLLPAWTSLTAPGGAAAPQIERKVAPSLPGAVSKLKIPWLWLGVGALGVFIIWRAVKKRKTEAPA